MGHTHYTLEACLCSFSNLGSVPNKFIPHVEARGQKALDNKGFGKVFVDFYGTCWKNTCICFVSVYESVRRHRHMLKQKLCVRLLGICARIQTGYHGSCQCFIFDEASLVKGKLCTIIEQGGCSSEILDRKNCYCTPKGFVFNICPIS